MKIEDTIIKYPRTPHIQGSRMQPGDEDLRQRPFSDIAGRNVVLEEKIDGANSAVSFTDDGELHLQSRRHFLTGGYRERHYDLMKQWGAVHKDRQQTVVDIARQSLDTKMELPPRGLLEEEEWLDRTSWHVGVDEEGKHHSLFPKLGVQSNVASMGKAVRKMANDTDSINLILEDIVD